MESGLELYNKEAKESYYFESNENYYVDKDKLIMAQQRTLVAQKWDKEYIDQIATLFMLEDLKIQLAKGEIDIKQFRSRLVESLKQFHQQHGISVFEKTTAHDLFYMEVNKTYRED